MGLDFSHARTFTVLQPPAFPKKCLLGFMGLSAFEAFLAQPMDPVQSEKTARAGSTEKRDNMWNAYSSASLEDCVKDQAKGTA
eukprot:9478322-Pyramimonas_sp.AAC.1